jgi:WD40 repeat protein/HEAT repeat protein
MTPESTGTTERDQRLHAILATCLETLENGHPLDQGELLARHPEFAAELADFFAGRDQVDRLAAPLREMTSGLPDGTTIRYVGDYEVQAEIARGGMGVVYRARQVSLNRPVALKMILAGQLASETDVRRFKREAEAAANLDHPNIVPIYEVGEHQGQHYFSMKLIEDGNLAEYLQSNTLSPQDAARLLATVARAVHYAHQRGILHRDLKPANVLLAFRETASAARRDEYEPHVTDFGLARRVEGGGGPTQSGAVVGTPSYMAPEQARAERAVSIAADVYSLGAILYELLTGRPPFRADNPLETLLQVMEKDPPRPRTLNPSADRDLETICLKCLDKDPVRRYATAEALAEDLERWLNGEQILARPGTTWERAVKWVRRRPAVAALISVSVAAAVALLVVGLVYDAQLGAATRAAEEQRQQARQEHEEARQANEAAGQAHEAARRAESESRGNLYRSRVGLARTEWLTGNPALGAALLDQCPAELRRWEWHHVNRVCRAERFLLTGHTGAVLALAFSPDGGRLATSSFDGSVRVWDVVAGKELLCFRRHTQEPWSLSFSPDGKRIASSCSQLGTTQMNLVGTRPAKKPDLMGEILIWDAATGEKLLDIGQEHRGVITVCFHPDGKRLFSTGHDQSVRVWDAATGKKMHQWNEAQEVQGAVVSPDGRQVLVGAGDKLKVYDAATYKELYTLRALFALNKQRAACYSPDSKYLAGVGDQGTIYVWDAATGQPALSLGGHTGPVTALDFSRDGKHLASGGEDGLVKVWDLANRKELYLYRAHADMVTAVAFSPDGQLLASVGADVQRELYSKMPLFGSGEAVPCSVKVWEAAGGQEYRLFSGDTICAALSPNTRQVAFAARKGHEVQVCDAVTGNVVHTFPEFKPQVSRLAYSPDGKSLALVLFRRDFTANGLQVLDEVKVFDTATWKERLDLGKIGGEVAEVQFTGDGRHLVVACEDGLVLIREATTGKPGPTIVGGRGGLTRIALSPEGQRLARVAVYDGTLDVWDVATGNKLIAPSGIKGRCWGLAFSPDGQRLAAGSGKEVVLFDVTSGQVLSRVAGFTEMVRSVAFPPGDGDRLAVIDGKAVKLLDLGNRQEVLSFRGDFHDVTFSRDGHFLMAQKEKGVQLWDARPPQTQVVAKLPVVVAPLPKPPTEPPPDTRPEAVRSALRKGIEQLDKGDRGAALLWFVEALKAEPDAERQRLHRLRISLLLQEIPKLRPLIPRGGQLTDFVSDKVAELPTTLDRTDPVLTHYYHMLLSPDGRRLALWNYNIDTRTEAEDKKQGRSPYRLQVFDSRSWQPLGPAIDTVAPLYREQVTFSKDGRCVVTFHFQGHPGVPLDSPPPELLEKQVRNLGVWDVATGKQVGTAMRLPWPVDEIERGHIFQLDFSADGRWVTAGEVSQYNSRMGAWEVQTGKPLNVPERYHYVSFSPDGKRALTMWNQHLAHRVNLAAHVWDLDTGKQTGPPIDVEEVRLACFSPDGRRVLIVERYWLGVWDVATGRRLHSRLTAEVAERGKAAAMSPDGRLFAAVVGNPPQVGVWDAATGGPAAPPISTSCQQVEFTPDSRCLLTSGGNGARLWDAATGEPLSPFLNGMGKWDHWYPFIARLTPDGKELYTRLRQETNQFQGRRLLPELAPVADLARLAQALSGRQVGAKGDLMSLPAADLLALRRDMQARFPAAFGTPVGKPDQVLKELPDPRVSMLLEILADPRQSAKQQRLAANRLGELSAAGALPALEAALRDNPAPEVRAQAAEALARLSAGQKTVVPLLVAALQQDGSSQVRGAAARALGSHGLAIQATGELILALQTDADYMVRTASAAALRTIDPKTTGVVPALRSALNDKHPLVRISAAGTLIRHTPDAPDLVAILIAGLEPDKEQSPTRYLAARYLFRLGVRATDAVPALIAIVKRGRPNLGSVDETAYAIQALGKIGPAAKDAISVLIEKLPVDRSHPNWPNEHGYISEFDNPVAVALARIGAATIPELVRTLKEGKDDHQRIGAVIALGYLGPAGKEALPELEAALKKARDPKLNDWGEDGWHLGVSALEKAIANIRNPKAQPPADPWQDRD